MFETTDVQNERFVFPDVHVNTHMYQLQPFSLQIAIQNI